MTESNPILDKYMSLDQGERVQVLYVWIDGSGESMRCKTKTVEKEAVVPGDLPIWNFDGSSCYQAEGCNSDVYLHPVALFRDPFRRGKNKIALCETYNFDHKPGVSNYRYSCDQAMENKKVKADTFTLLMGGWSGFKFDSEDNYRDVMWQGTADDGCVALADLLGWKDELLKLVDTEHKKINEATAKVDESQNTGEKTKVDKSAHEDKDAKKPDKDSANL